MKKILLLLIGLTIISCGNTTDPIIGTWKTNHQGAEYTFVYNSNGSVEEISNEIITGTWENENKNINFDLLNQSYTLVFDDITFTWAIIFSEDFSSLTFSDREGGAIYRKQ